MKWLMPGHGVLKDDTTGIEKHKVFDAADYTVLDYAVEFQASCQRIVRFFGENYSQQKVYLMGIGTSGAMVMALIQHYMLNSPYQLDSRLQYILLRKPGEECHRNTKQWVKADAPIFLVDDHVASGSTMCRLASNIRENVIVDGGGALPVNMVHGIIAEHCHRLLFTVVPLQEYYPNLKYLLH